MEPSVVEEVIDTMSKMEGTFDIWFVGEFEPKRLILQGAIRRSDGSILYLIGLDKVTYNYSNVISTRKIH